MNQIQSTMQLDDLMQQNAVSVLVWLKNIESDFIKPPFGFNWLGLAEAATFEAQSASDLAWAGVAISVYERLAAEANSSTQESLIISAMLLRASMIARFGSVPGHLVLDIDHIMRWFCAQQMMSWDSVAKMAASWRSCNIEEIRELRRIKNRLRVISMLAESHKYILNPELNNWLSLRDKLP